MDSTPEQAQTRSPAAATSRTKGGKTYRLPPYKGLRPAPRHQHRVHPSWLMTSIVVAGLLGAAAFLYDAYKATLSSAKAAVAVQPPTDLLLGVTLATNRYQDPLGRFSIALPPGWSASLGGTNVSHDALLSGPDRLQLFIVVAEAPGETIEHLKERFGEMELEQLRMTHIEEVDFHGRRALSRFCRMDLHALRSLDFLVGETSYHLMGVIPRDKFESHQPVIAALIDTMRPAAPP